MARRCEITFTRTGERPDRMYVARNDGSKLSWPRPGGAPAASARTVRPARSADADAIAALHVAAWQVAYRGLLDDEVIAARTLERRRTTWSEHLAAPPRRHVTLVATAANGELLGFADAGASRDEGAAPDTGEVNAIYVHPKRTGQGVGRVLLAGAEEALRERGFHRATLWALAGNGGARRFYEAAGWAAAGARRPAPGGLGAESVRYGKPLTR
jgi:GNAT superfamily N-acetyltransferase